MFFLRGHDEANSLPHPAPEERRNLARHFSAG